MRLKIFPDQISSRWLLLAALMTIFLTVGALGCAASRQTGSENKGADNVPFLNEPGLIDAHAHIGTFQGFDLSLETLLANLTENHVQYAFVSNIDGAALPGVTADGDEVKINEETARVCAAHPALKPLVWSKPGAKNASAANVEPFLRDQHFYGIKFHPDFNHFDADAAEVKPYLQLCEKYHVPALFHCGRSSHSNPKQIYAIAKQYPTVPFVLYHMGFNTAHQDAIEVARQAKQQHDALIYLETAQCQAEDVLAAFQAVGADRVLFGSDATYFGRQHYQFYLPQIRAAKEKLSVADFQKFIHGNAVEIFHLEK